MLEDLERQQPPMTEPVVRRPVTLVREALVPVAATAASESARRVVVLQSELPNAFAIPGGHIVITTGLLHALRSPDELAAVFAHEWGHVTRRHVLRSILRQASLQILLSLVAGDQSALSSGLRTAGELGSLSYSRGYEREADDEAMALLAAHGASPEALGDALESIREAAGTGEGTLGFLSTHPAPKERFARILEASKRLPVSGQATWRDTAAWDAMKQALGAE
jgi:predicted Zn-dependent protease